MICTNIFIAMLFIITPLQKQVSKYPSILGWINELVCVHRMKFYMIINTNELQLHAALSVKLTDIRVTEINQIQPFI